jgi:hypothetical protein
MLYTCPQIIRNAKVAFPRMTSYANREEFSNLLLTSLPLSRLIILGGGK